MFGMDDLLHQVMYSFARSLAGITWGFDRAGLGVTDLLERFSRMLVDHGFTQALDVVSQEVIGINRAALELALVLGALLLIALPIAPLQWVNVRKVLVSALLFPLLAPSMVGAVQDLDGVRSGLGDSLYRGIVSQVRFDLVDDHVDTGTTQDMGPVVSFRGDRTTLHAIDVAAAYLYATRADVLDPTRKLPHAFEERYFPYPTTMVGNTPDPWAVVEEGWSGIIRTVYGAILVLFAFCETLIDFLFRIALGFLVIAGLIAFPLSYFSMFQGIFQGILGRIAEVLIQSWTISAIMALLLSATITVAQSGQGFYVLGMGILGLYLSGMFVLVAVKTVINAITGAGMSSSLSPMEAMFGLRTLRRAATSAPMKLAGAATAAGGLSGIAPATALAVAGGAHLLGRAGGLAQMMRGGMAPPPGQPGRTPPAPPPAPEPLPLAPIAMPQIAQAIAQLGSRPEAIDGPPSAAVARQLKTSPAAFGTKSRAVDDLVTSLQAHPLPAGLAEQMIREVKGEGGMRSTTREQAQTIWDATQALGPVRGARQLAALEKQMKAIPDSLSAADQMRTPLDADVATSPHLTTYRYTAWQRRTRRPHPAAVAPATTDAAPAADAPAPRPPGRIAQARMQARERLRQRHQHAAPDAKTVERPLPPLRLRGHIHHGQRPARVKAQHVPAAAPIVQPPPAPPRPKRLRAMPSMPRLRPLVRARRWVERDHPPQHMPQPAAPAPIKRLPTTPRMAQRHKGEQSHWPARFSQRTALPPRVLPPAAPTHRFRRLHLMPPMPTRTPGSREERPSFVKRRSAPPAEEGGEA